MPDVVTTTVDLSPIVTPLITLAGAVLTAAAGAIVAWLDAKAKERGIQISAQQIGAIDGAIKTSVGVMVTELARGAKPLEQITVNDPGIRQQAQRVIDAVPDAVAAQGPDGQPLSADTIATKIVAGIGHAIAGDPTIPTVPVVTSGTASSTDQAGRHVDTTTTSTTATETASPAPGAP